MTWDWRPLDEALERQETPLPVWWRDDDAIQDTAALHTLFALADQVDWPLHLAVIPARADDSLARCLRSAAHVVPLTHGWAHQSHARPLQKNAEYGATRDLAVMAGEAGRARARLGDLLDDPPAPMFVPPWNRIAPDLLPLLAGEGYTMLSTFAPRRVQMPCPGLTQINTHLDPIHWRGGRSLVPPKRLIAQMAQDLRDRQDGRTDATEPYGLLTHHLVHDDAIWTFVADLLARLSKAPLVHWDARHPLTREPLS
ncbi:MAG: polysaccharide deacetylase family protein [Pseudomonadota bacterium]